MSISSTWVQGTTGVHHVGETVRRLEDVEAFSRDRMLEHLVRLTHDGYSITLFDWLACVPPDLRGVAIQAFRRTDTPRVAGVNFMDLVDYVDRMRETIGRRLEMRGPKEA
jgi:hypothetical protein